MFLLQKKCLALYGLLAGSVISSAAGLVFEHRQFGHAEIDSLLGRAETNNLEWPCPPVKNMKPSAKTKDAGAAVGVLGVTAAMLADGNSNYEGLSNGTIPSGEEEEEPANAIEALNEPAPAEPGLTKRLGGAITELLNRAIVKVPTDGGELIYWQHYLRTPEDLVVATQDLSGCTVIIISSPYVAFMIHVWERRDEETWLSRPNGHRQRAKDEEFVAAGKLLIENLIASGLGYGARRSNGFNGWLPRAETVVHVIAPAANPEYRGNPMLEARYTRDTRKHLFYENGAYELLKMACRKVGIREAEGEMHTYRRRFHSDPAHGADDRDKIALAPYIHRGRVYVNMLWDDNKLKPITRIA